jgi:YggT family protein
LTDIKTFIYVLYQVYFYMVLIYVLMSWLPSVRASFVGEFLGKLVEPYLRPFRRLIPPLGGVMDISPIVALLALRFVALGLEAVVDFFNR